MLAKITAKGTISARCGSRFELFWIVFAKRNLFIVGKFRSQSLRVFVNYGSLWLEIFFFRTEFQNLVKLRSPYDSSFVFSLVSFGPKRSVQFEAKSIILVVTFGLKLELRHLVFRSPSSSENHHPVHLICVTSLLRRKLCLCTKEKNLKPQASVVYKNPQTLGSKLTNYKQISFGKNNSEKLEPGSTPCGNCALCGNFGKHK